MIFLKPEPVISEILGEKFSARLKYDVPLSRFTAARLGGAAEAFIEVQLIDEIIQIASACWEANYPFRFLGGGSNVLISDAGVRGLVVVNRAREMRFDLLSEPPRVWAESGAGFAQLAQLSANHGLSGLEWAAGIPGTLGGAVVGNAGAHGEDIAGTLKLAEILHRMDADQKMTVQQEEWSVSELDYEYRNSVLKRCPGRAIVLAATLELKRSKPGEVRARMEALGERRRRTQPPGASMGSIFKNPTGDYAGRLIDAAGLKGSQIGGAQISLVHGNFFINKGKATAKDYYLLIEHARREVQNRFNVQLELEIELMGEW